jgi:hypothetical protein
MAKRQNRIVPIEHEIRQITNLKTLLPNATAPEAQIFSDYLIDIAVAALEEVALLESGQPVQLKRVARLIELVNRMTAIAQSDYSEEK